MEKKRYTLVMENDVYAELQQLAKTTGKTVAAILKDFISIGFSVIGDEARFDLVSKDNNEKVIIL